jgi:hypothetical protein
MLPELFLQVLLCLVVCFNACIRPMIVSSSRCPGPGHLLLVSTLLKFYNDIELVSQPPCVFFNCCSCSMPSSIVKNQVDGLLSRDPRHLLVDLGADSRHGLNHKLAVAGYVLLNEAALRVEAANCQVLNGKLPNVTMFFSNLNFL